MAKKLKKRDVVEEDGVIGTMQGDTFVAESNFKISAILKYVILLPTTVNNKTTSGFLVMIQSKMNAYERYIKPVKRKFFF